VKGDIDLDHLAVAVERADDAYGRYRRDLGGAWRGGTAAPGFNWTQVAYANGMRVEVLEPANVEQFDFLRRFLDRSGPGPHHITCKVRSLDDALARVAAVGVAPASVNRSEPNWQEAFLHPKDACGIVVQLAQPGPDDGDDPVHSLEPEGLPAPALDPGAVFVHIVLAVADLDRAVTLWRALGGTPDGRGTSAEGTWVDLAWPGPGRLRLLAPAPGSRAASWMGEGPGRFWQATFAVAEPAAVPGAVATAEGWEVPPDANHGTRLRLVTP